VLTLRLSGALVLVEILAYLSGSAVLGDTQGVVNLPFYILLTAHELLGLLAGLLSVLTLLSCMKDFWGMVLSLASLEGVALAGYSGLLYLRTGDLDLVFTMALLNVISIALTALLLGRSSRILKQG